MLFSVKYHIVRLNQVVKSPLNLSVMPARTLNDFFAGFFYAGIRAGQEVGMVITYKGQGNGDVEKIKVEGDEEKEVTVRHENVPVKWKTWNDEDFSREWNKTYLN